MPVHTCAECQQPFNAGEMIPFGEHWVCAQCKPRYLQRLKEGAVLPGELEYGSFAVRFVAKVIDGLIMSPVSIGLNFVMGSGLFGEPASPGGFFAIFGLVNIIQQLLAASYSTFFVGRYAATPGKMIMKLKIVTADGGPVSYQRALARHFAEMISGLTLMIGYLMAAFDEQRRSLHDRICNTRVVINRA